MAERLRGDNVLLQMFRTSHAVRDLMAAAVAGPLVMRPAFGDLWLAHLRGTTVWRFRVGLGADSAP